MISAFGSVWFSLTITRTKMVKNEKITNSLMKTKTRTEVDSVLLSVPWYQPLVEYCEEYLPLKCPAAAIFTYFLPSPPLDNIQVMVIVWRLRGNIIRTALCWIVWHNVHSMQHTYMSSSYMSDRLGLSHWDPYAVRRGGCLELYYGGVVLVGFKPDLDDQLVSFSALTLLVWSSGL